MFFYVLTMFGQDVITINAFVLNKKTNAPIKYVNVGFIGKGIGTVSDSKGNFVLSYYEDDIDKEDILQISVLGFKPIRYKASELFKIFSDNNKIYLNPTQYKLDEVLITGKKRAEFRIGISTSNKLSMGYWKDKRGLGGEIASLVKIKKRNTKLLDLKFNIVENISDSIRVRVNIYERNKRFPGKNILNRNIIHTISRKSGIETINLEPYNIYVNNDIIVSLELLEVFGNNIGFAISAENVKGNSYTKEISQDKWKRHSNSSIGFTTLVSANVSDNYKIIRDKPKKIIVYWDASLSMKSRDLDKELILLENYILKTNPYALRIIKFSDTINEVKDFSFRKESLKEILNYLRKSNNQGGTNFTNVLKNNEFGAETALLFSDGHHIFEALQPNISIPLFTISSIENSKHEILQQAASYGNGHYIDLSRISVKNGLINMLNEEYDFTDYSKKSIIKTIKGVVESDSIALQGATVSIKNTFEEVQTDENGFFEINAKKNDVLTFQFLGMDSKDIVVENEIDSLFVNLSINSELLQEVLVNADIYNKRLVDFGAGSRDYNSIGYAVNTLVADDIRPNAITIADVLRGRFAGVNVTRDGKVFMRGLISPTNSTPAAFDIDGVIYHPDNVPFIDPQLIDRITVLKSLSSTTRYGFLGRGGVIVVRTKAIKFDDTPKIDSLLVKGNNYNEEKLEIINDKKFSTQIARELNLTSSLLEAKELFNEFNNKRNPLAIQDYIEASEYFMNFDSLYAKRILSNIGEVAYFNPKALKILAFKLEELGDFKKAKIVYERIVSLQPKVMQNYLNLARIYKNINEYELSMDLYKKMISNSIVDVDFSIAMSQIKSELMHLITVHRTKVDFNDLPNNLRIANFKYDTRLEFEWTDPYGEFEFQFVNPKKKFYTWTQSMLENQDEMVQRLHNGYYSKEFIIDNVDPGEWIINIQNLKVQKSNNPIYLKYTIYKRYGLPDEIKKIRIIKLYNQSEKITLDKFIN